MFKQQQAVALALVAVSIEGKTVHIDPNSIDKFDRTVLHGEYKGTQVNSPAVAEVGDSLIVWPEANEPDAFAMKKASAGIFAKKLLESDGFAVTLKQGT